MTRFRNCHHFVIFALICFAICVKFAQSFPDPGRFSMIVNSSQQYNSIVKNVYNGTKVFVKIRCESDGEDPTQKPHVKIGWVLRETLCWNEYAFLDSQMADVIPTYYNKPEVRLDLPGYKNHTPNYVRQPVSVHQCDNVITLNDFDQVFSN